MSFRDSFPGWFHASFWHWMGRVGSVAAASTSLVLAVFGHVHLFWIFVAWIISNLFLMAYAWKFKLHPIFWLEMVYIGINVILTARKTASLRWRISALILRFR